MGNKYRVVGLDSIQSEEPGNFANQPHTPRIIDIGNVPIQAVTVTIGINV